MPPSVFLSLHRWRLSLASTSGSTGNDTIAHHRRPGTSPFYSRPPAVKSSFARDVHVRSFLFLEGHGVPQNPPFSCSIVAVSWAKRSRFFFSIWQFRKKSSLFCGESWKIHHRQVNSNDVFVNALVNNSRTENPAFTHVYTNLEATKKEAPLTR